MRVVLASKSPRRQELLKLIYDEFEAIPAVGEEISTASDTCSFVMELAMQKAKEVFDNVEAESDDLLVIGSDTVVAFCDEILGKPKDEADAINMLKKLSGNTHQVYTGVSLIRKKGESVLEKHFYEKCDVTFVEMTDIEIADYVATKEPMDKAGAYGIQGIAGKYISGICGDYYTVMGFPVARINQELKGDFR